MAFCQILWDRGLSLNGEVIIPSSNSSSGSVGVPVAGLLLLDPVTTGYKDSLIIPENVTKDNCVAVRARDELRYVFQATDFGPEAPVKVITSPGNHCDIGGGYSESSAGAPPHASAISALVYLGQVNFFKTMGLPLGEVQPNRVYDPSLRAFIHTEGVDSEHKIVWSESGSFGSARLINYVNGGESTYSSALLYRKGDGDMIIKPDWFHESFQMCGVASQDLTYFRSGEDLLIKIALMDDKVDTLRIISYYRYDQSPLDKLLLDGNQEIKSSIFAYPPVILQGTHAEDTLSLYHDTIAPYVIAFGQDRNDTITGTDGNDQLHGGPGDDHISSGSGNDTYWYKSGEGFDTYTLGSGSDTIVFENLSARDLALANTSDGRQVILQTNTGEALIAFEDIFSAGSSVLFKFSDASTLTYASSAYDVNQVHYFIRDHAGFVFRDGYVQVGGTQPVTSGLPAGLDMTSWSDGQGYESTSIWAQSGEYRDYFGKNAAGENWHYFVDASGQGFYNYTYANGDFWQSVMKEGGVTYSKYSQGGNTGYSVSSNCYYFSESLDFQGHYNLTLQDGDNSYVYWTDSANQGGVSATKNQDTWTQITDATGRTVTHHFDATGQGYTDDSAETWYTYNGSLYQQAVAVGVFSRPDVAAPEFVASDFSGNFGFI